MKNDDLFFMFTTGKLMGLLLPFILIISLFQGCTEAFSRDSNYKSPGIKQELKKLHNMIFD